MKMFYCLMLMLCPLWNWAQSSLSITPLTIGDRVPDVKFNEVLNAPYTNTSLASATDKLLLIDFWATWCSSCISEFPKLDSLQHQFGDSLRILLVNNPYSGDTKESIVKFFGNRKNSSGKKMALAVIEQGEQLGKMFPHTFIPHTVWIYKGKVKAITSSAAINAAVIRDILGDRPVRLEFKEDQMDFNPSLPLLQAGNGGTNASVLSRSVFTAYLPGVGTPSGVSISGDSALRRRYFVNMPLLRLYSFVFNDLPSNRVILEGNIASGLITIVADSAWKAGHYYCYELTVPFSTSREQIRRCMQKDLDSYFGLYSRMERRLIDCYALVLTGDSMAFQSKGVKKAQGLLKNDAGIQTMYCQPLSIFTDALNRQYPGFTLRPVVLDETGYTGLADLELKIKDLQDLAALRKVLQPVGLDIISCKREINMLIISPSKFY